MPDTKQQHHDNNRDDKSSRRNSSSTSSNRYAKTGPQQQDSLDDVPDINSNNQDVSYHFFSNIRSV